MGLDTGYRKCGEISQTLAQGNGKKRKTRKETEDGKQKRVNMERSKVGMKERCLNELATTRDDLIILGVTFDSKMTFEKHLSSVS